MAELGFTTYVQPAPSALPTLAERFAVLTGTEKLAILDGFKGKIIASRLKRKIGLAEDLIEGVYLAIDAIEELSRLLMREEGVVVEAIMGIDDDPQSPTYGELIELVSAEYNEAPTSIADLKLEIIANSTGLIFTEAEIGVVIDTMILYSELDEDGTPIGTVTVYANEVVK